MRERFKKEMGIKDDEKILLFTRKHWMKFLFDAGLYIIATAVFGGMFLYSLATGWIVTHPVLVFVLSLGFLVSLMGLFYAWTNHYLDLWVVTNKRIIHIEQHNFFHRTKSTIRVEKIQNVSIKRKGFLEEMFNFGTISVETAGYKTFVTQMHHIPNPSKVAKVIMDQLDKRIDNSITL